MNWKSGRWVGLAALLLVASLTACGDASATPGASAGAVALPTATPIPTFTPAPTAKPQANLVTSQAISGTISEYDPATRTLALQGSDGKITKYGLDQASVSKSESLSAGEFGKALTDSTLVQVNGEKGLDGVFAAQSLVLLLDISGDTAIFTGPDKGTAGAAITQVAMTPGASTPGNQVIGANGTPGAPPPPGKAVTFIGGGPGDSPLLKNAKLADNVLTGDSLAGSPIKASLSGSTLYSRRVKGSLQDLKAGQSVTLDLLPAQGNGPAQAIRVTIN